MLYFRKMAELRDDLDRDHPCLACGAPWRVLVEARVVENRFIVWKRRGEGECAAGCMRTDREAYNRGLAERARRGWSTQLLGTRARPTRRTRQLATHGPTE
jgi:hypothetical protein